MGWFHSVKNPKIKSVKKPTGVSNPSSQWRKCKNCSEIIQNERLVQNLNICPYCDYHYRLTATERIELIIDAGSFKEELIKISSNDPLGFVDTQDYKKRLSAATEKSKKFESSQCGLASINSKEIAIAVMDFSFMGGSMGVVTGEKITRAMELGIENNCPVIVVSASGGARMQEGILSLMQMAKTSAVRAKLKEKNIPYISIMTDPTTGGCAASFAMQGDINIAEPGALIGFAGPRVIEQSIRQKLPEGFQRSEFLQEHGFLDRIVHRKNLKKELDFFLRMFFYDK